MTTHTPALTFSGTNTIEPATRTSNSPWRRVLRTMRDWLPTIELGTREYMWAESREELERTGEVLESLGHRVVGRPWYCYVPEAKGMAWRQAIRRAD